MGRRSGVGGRGVVVSLSRQEHSVFLIRITVREGRKCGLRGNSVSQRSSLWGRDWSWLGWWWSGGGSTSGGHGADVADGASSGEGWNIVGTVLWQMTRSPGVTGRTLPLRAFDRPMPPISTVLAEVERTYSGNRVRPPTQYIRGTGDDVVGVHEEPEDVVSNLELSFDCCLQKLVERRWEGFLRRFTLSFFDEDRVEDECEFLMFLIVVLGIDESFM